MCTVRFPVRLVPPFLATHPAGARRIEELERLRPWCTDQRDGRIEPNALPGSRDADGLRASELQHPIQDVGADGDLGRPARVGA